MTIKADFTNIFNFKNGATMKRKMIKYLNVVKIFIIFKVDNVEEHQEFSPIPSSNEERGANHLLKIVRALEFAIAY